VHRSRLAQTITVVAAPCCSLSSAVSGILSVAFLGRLFKTNL